MEWKNKKKGEQTNLPLWTRPHPSVAPAAPLPGERGPLTPLLATGAGPATPPHQLSMTRWPRQRSTSSSWPPNRPIAPCDTGPAHPAVPTLRTLEDLRHQPTRSPVKVNAIPKPIPNSTISKSIGPHFAIWFAKSSMSKRFRKTQSKSKNTPQKLFKHPNT